jgi:hypothetical protein
MVLETMKNHNHCPCRRVLLHFVAEQAAGAPAAQHLTGGA